MTTNTLSESKPVLSTQCSVPEIRINTTVPEPILAALARIRDRGRYSSLKHVFHCIEICAGMWVGVAGDGDNCGYEHFLFADGKLTITDVGYGCPEIALRDVLIGFHGNPLRECREACERIASDVAEYGSLEVTMGALEDAVAAAKKVKESEVAA